MKVVTYGQKMIDLENVKITADLLAICGQNTPLKIAGQPAMALFCEGDLVRFFLDDLP